jgi:hypothetical protein
MVEAQLLPVFILMFETFFAMSYIYKTYQLSPKTNTLHSAPGSLIMLPDRVWILCSGIDGDLMLVSPAARRDPTAD